MGDTDNKKARFAVVKTYSAGGSLVVVIPKKYSDELKIKDGDYLIASIVDGKLVYEKVIL